MTESLHLMVLNPALQGCGRIRLMSQQLGQISCLQLLPRSAAGSAACSHPDIRTSEFSSICGHHLDQRAPHRTRAPSKVKSAWQQSRWRPEEGEQVLAMADVEFAAAQAAGNSGHYRAPQQQLRRGRGGQYPRQGDGRPPKAQRTSAVHQAAPAIMAHDDTGDLQRCCAVDTGDLQRCCAAV